MTSINGSKRTRLVLCVDGTWCREDGTGTLSGNQTNLFRIYASVKRGECRDEATGITYEQRVVYKQGLGAKRDLDLPKKVIAGAFGKGITALIEEVYEECCRLNENDEVWLYGFSRGAFAIRAVAGMLHHIRAIKSTGKEFRKDFKEALEKYKMIRRANAKGEMGATYYWMMEKTKPAPRIQFIGAFDTVKAVSDEDLHDLSLNKSVQHMRHVLALHEDRVAMEPECIYPDFGESDPILEDRTFIQAWFAGAHMDMGGSKSSDGLSLYPLQWILNESKIHGLALEFKKMNNSFNIDNPLELVFPQGVDEYVFTALNGIKVGMYDMRSIHVNPRYNSRFNLKINSQRSWLWKKQDRTIFNDDDRLMGHYKKEPQGTIIHPSVYYLLFSNVGLTILDSHENKLQSRINRIQMNMLGVVGELSDGNVMINPGFWNDGQTEELDSETRFPIRILVCGNVGVGKSTLINRVFGVETTTPMARERGEHDIEEEHTWENRPDLIVHDSRGFEAASQTEIDSVAKFLAKFAGKTEPRERLHIIWFCIETSSDRTMQMSTELLFKIISDHAANVPLLVVTTKKDRFLRDQYGDKQDMLIEEGREHDPQLHEECNAFAKEQLNERVKLIEEEMRKVMTEEANFHLQACVPVARGDDESIKNLTRETIRSIDNDAVRLQCISAQVCDIDAKVDLALKEVMKRYKAVLGTASACGFIPSAGTIERTSAAYACCKTIIRCFGLPSVEFKTAYEILKTNIVDDLGNNLMVAFAEAVAVVGALGTFALPGLVVATGVANIPLIVPATARIYLILACDLILILVRSFGEALRMKIGQPTQKELSRHARDYRWCGMASEVHDRVKLLVPRHKLFRCYRIDGIRVGMEAIIRDYKTHSLQTASQQVQRPADSSRRRSSETIESDKMLISDLKKAKNEVERTHSESSDGWRSMFSSTSTLLSRQTTATISVDDPEEVLEKFE